MISESGRIISNIKVATNIWRLDIQLPQIVAKRPHPGQFVELLIDPSFAKPLRRPMSIAGYTADVLSIIYKTFGEATRILTTRIAGDFIDVIGPLGNHFKLIEDDYSTPVLLAGGVGIPPILWLHQELNRQKQKHFLIIGARTKAEHFINPDNEKTILTTDDGSLGIKGTVIPVLNKIISNVVGTRIFACGPEPMLRAIQKIALATNQPAQLSIESHMACGVGLCQGCAIKRRNYQETEHSYHEKYALVCSDGPVFKAGEIDFD